MEPGADQPVHESEVAPVVAGGLAQPFRLGGEAPALAR